MKDVNGFNRASVPPTTTKGPAQAACAAVAELVSQIAQPPGQAVVAARQHVLGWLVEAEARRHGVTEAEATQLAGTLPAVAGAELPHAVVEPVRRQVLTALANSREPLELGTLYEVMLAHEYDAEDAGRALAARRRSGSYYTPPKLVGALLDTTLEPRLNVAQTPQQLTALRICDPACGTGHFLLAAAARLVQRLLALRTGTAEAAFARNDQPHADNDEQRRQAWHDVLAHCIYGFDTDALAVAVARIRLVLAAGAPELAYSNTNDEHNHDHGLDDDPGHDRHRAIAEHPGDTDSESENEGVENPGGLPRHVRCGNGLFDSLPGAQGFDAVIGNPPFLNAIERDRLDAETKRRLRATFPRLRGTADLAYYFLARAAQLVAPGRGRVGLVMPRNMLNATALHEWRRTLAARHGLRPEYMYAPAHGTFFAGADIHICLLTLGPGSRCRVSDAPQPNPPASAAWHEGRVGEEEANWWAAFTRILSGDEPPATEQGTASVAHSTATSVTLESRFEVRASMTAPEAYELRPLLCDAEHGDGQRLHTTGLIDPGTSHWGRRTCRYLKRTYQHPRVQRSSATEPLSRSLQRRLAEGTRPKLLVAGLSRVVECWFDRHGLALGAVSTYTITHPEDDVAALAALETYLNSAPVTQRFQRELGGNAMSGGNITVTKAWLKCLPIPSELHAPLSPA